MNTDERTVFEHFRDQVTTRRSCLDFTGEEVPHNVVLELLDLAVCAPSETNLQPWRFITATGAAVDKVISAFIPPNQPKVRAAGNVVLVYADVAAIETNEKAAAFYRMGFTTPRDFAIRNASLAAMQFMLAAHVRGLATRPMAGYDPAVLDELLDIPGTWVSVMSIILGYPTKIANTGSPSRVPARDVTSFL